MPKRKRKCSSSVCKKIHTELNSATSATSSAASDYGLNAGYVDPDFRKPPSEHGGGDGGGHISIDNGRTAGQLELCFPIISIEGVNGSSAQLLLSQPRFT